jgi:hypothetical protein
MSVRTPLLGGGGVGGWWVRGVAVNYPLAPSLIKEGNYGM